MAKRRRRRNPNNNHPGLGAFLGSFAGLATGHAIAWSAREVSNANVPSWPLAFVGSVGGGALGAHIGAARDRKQRSTTGGAIGGLFGPIGAAAGGYIGGLEKDRRRNPDRLTTALIVGGSILAAGAGGYGIYRLYEARKAKKALGPGAGPEGAVGPTDPVCGPNYPGFVFDGDKCVPTQDTPSGIYLTDACTDFIFVGGENGSPQIQYLENAVQQAAAAQDADPTDLATQFLSTFWPQCPWPPQGGTERIVQLYMALSHMLARQIRIQGGKVFGFDAYDAIDEAVADRLAQMGFEVFTPDVVSEIEIPPWPDEGGQMTGQDAQQPDAAPDIDLPPQSEWYVYEKSQDGSQWTIAVLGSAAAQFSPVGKNYSWYVWRIDDTPKTVQTARSGKVQIESPEDAQAQAEQYVEGLGYLTAGLDDA